MASSFDAKERQRSQKMIKLPKHINTIERIYAKSGTVHIQNKDGKTQSLPLAEACQRGLMLLDWQKDPNVPKWHKEKAMRLADMMTKACAQAKAQLQDKEDRGANVIRELFDGVDAEGKPVSIEITDDLVHRLHQQYFMVSEDELILMLRKEMPIGLHTYSARTSLIKKVHEKRCEQENRVAYPELDNPMFAAVQAGAAN
jgi:hypothetical protein